MAQIEDLEARLDELTASILLPLRTTRSVDHGSLNQLYSLVDDLAEELAGSPTVPRLLVGKLWFVFTQMLAEAERTLSREDILNAAWGYESHLEGIFGPFISTSPPDPGVTAS